MSLSGSALNSTCSETSLRSAAFSSGVLEKTGGCQPAISSTGADMIWLRRRPLLKLCGGASGGESLRARQVATGGQRCEGFPGEVGLR